MRKIKMFGLLAMAALALVAFVGTSSASAAAFTAGGAGETLNHTLIEDHVFTITGSAVECETVDFNGTTTGASASELQVTPVYEDCQAFGFAEASVDPDGCRFSLKASTTGDPGHSTVLLHNCEKPTEGIKISVNVPFFATCVADVPEQSIDTMIKMQNVNGQLRIKTTGSKVMVDVTTSTGFCPLTTGTHSGANGGTYSGESALTTAKGLSYSP
jgi:hypothetical protein